MNKINETTLFIYLKSLDISAPSLQKHAYIDSNIQKISPKKKKEKFQIKNSYCFISLLKKYIVGTHQNHNGEAVLMITYNLCFRAKIRKTNVYPCKPQFYYMKVGFKGVKII